VGQERQGGDRRRKQGPLEIGGWQGLAGPMLAVSTFAVPQFRGTSSSPHGSTGRTAGQQHPLYRVQSSTGSTWAEDGPAVLSR
jgi:hypothetical protein